MLRKDPVNDLLRVGLEEGVYPGAVLLVALDRDVVFLEKVGNASLNPCSVPMRRKTIFDLASLTKPLATSLACMKLVDEGRISLDQSLTEIIKASSLGDKGSLTPRLLLNHCGGLDDWRPYYLDLVKYGPEERKRILRAWLVDEPLVYQPGEACIYSDLGFMFLEWLVEEASGVSMDQFLKDRLYQPFGLERTFLYSESIPGSFQGEVFAATEDCPWRKRVLQGEVHDENAYALGGYSGHAGLFGTAEDVYRIVRVLLEHYRGDREDFFRQETVREFFTRQAIVGESTWALGWDTPSERESSSGEYFSDTSVGHLGFTGTSIWIDLERDLTVILLTNRIHPTRNNDRIRNFRPKLHNKIMEVLGFT